MLFFVLFALVFAQENDDTTTTTKTCYLPVKDGNSKVIGYVISEEEDCATPLTDKKPTIEGAHACVHTVDSCDDTDEFEMAVCAKNNTCVKVTDSSSVKHIIVGKKVTVESYQTADCTTAENKDKETSEQECGKCKTSGDDTVDVKCENLPEEKKKFCYEEAKDGDKVIAYIKTPEEDGECEIGSVKDKAPSIEGDVVCVNIAEAKGDKCEVPEATLELGICMDTDYCLPIDDTKSYAYDVSGDDIYLYEYSQKDCKGEPKKYKGKCGECVKDGEDFIQFTCGAFETAILLAIVFLFFLF